MLQECYVIMKHRKQRVMIDNGVITVYHVMLMFLCKLCLICLASHCCATMKEGLASILLSLPASVLYSFLQSPTYHSTAPSLGRVLYGRARQEQQVLNTRHI